MQYVFSKLVRNGIVFGYLNYSSQMLAVVQRQANHLVTEIHIEWNYG